MIVVIVIVVVWVVTICVVVMVVVMMGSFAAELHYGSCYDEVGSEELFSLCGDYGDLIAALYLLIASFEIWKLLRIFWNE